ncbi:unnamed protein product [Arabidopsis halleri]
MVEWRIRVLCGSRSARCFERQSFKGSIYTESVSI